MQPSCKATELLTALKIKEAGEHDQHDPWIASALHRHFFFFESSSR